MDPGAGSRATWKQVRVRPQGRAGKDSHCPPGRSPEPDKTAQGHVHRCCRGATTRPEGLQAGTLGLDPQTRGDGKRGRG